MLENFFILHRSGECIFQKAYHGERLPMNIIIGLSSAISMLISTTNKRKGVQAPTPSAAFLSSSQSSSSSAAEEKKGDSAAAKRLSQRGTAGSSSITSGAGAGKAPVAPTPRGGATGRLGVPGGGGGAAGGASTSTTGMGSIYAQDNAPLPFVEPACVTVNSLKLAAAEVGPYTLVAQSTASESDSFLCNILADVQQCLQFYLGAFLKVPDDTSHVTGVLDIVDRLLQGYATDLCALVQGVRGIFLEPRVRWQLDRILASLEENSEHVAGGALFLGESIVHTRIPHSVARGIVAHLAARPMTHSKMRTFPFFAAETGRWHHALLVRMRHMVLAVVLSVRVAFPSVLPLVDELEEAVAEAYLAIPAEEPPVLLRHFTGHDTAAFVYTQRGTGLTVAPPPRPGLVLEQGGVAGAGAGAGVGAGSGAGASSSSGSVHDIFSWFLARAAQAMGNQVPELQLHTRGYRFYAFAGETHALFVLYNDKVDAGAVERYNKEILDNIASSGIIPGAAAGADSLAAAAGAGAGVGAGAWGGEYDVFSALSLGAAQGPAAAAAASSSSSSAGSRVTPSAAAAAAGRR